ncbi:hypothetical protein [Nocardia sp. NPDC048505]|uniref:hypothetical protein n=1 Tax=unclassified Nocardia TaxID=2637762 RepID=UPI003400BB63
MTRTTGAPPFDVPDLVPGMAAHARWTVRLHPRLGIPRVRDSHVGGPLLWPVAQEWPCCESPYCDTAFGTPLTPLAQLRAADFPEITFPEGTDLVQFLWCTGDHGADTVQVRWRAAAEVKRVRPFPLAAEFEDAQEEYFPLPCVLHPERVLEYPWHQELPEELRRALRAWQPGPELYPPHYAEVATAPGFKVGGSMNWSGTDMPSDFACAVCSAPPFLLLQLDSREFTADSRWQPLEERHLSPGTYKYISAAQPTGLQVGRSSHAGVFVCSAQPEHLVEYIRQ